MSSFFAEYGVGWLSLKQPSDGQIAYYANRSRGMWHRLLLELLENLLCEPRHSLVVRRSIPFGGRRRDRPVRALRSLDAIGMLAPLGEFTRTFPSVVTEYRSAWRRSNGGNSDKKRYSLPPMRALPRVIEDKRGQRSIAPGGYVRMLLVTYCEGIDSQRGISWRCADGLSLRAFLGVPLEEASPEESTPTNSGNRLKHFRKVATHYEKARGELFCASFVWPRLRRPLNVHTT